MAKKFSKSALTLFSALLFSSGQSFALPYYSFGGGAEITVDGTPDSSFGMADPILYGFSRNDFVINVDTGGNSEIGMNSDVFNAMLLVDSSFTLNMNSGRVTSTNSGSDSTSGTFILYRTGTTANNINLLAETALRNEAESGGVAIHYYNTEGANGSGTLNITNAGTISTNSHADSTAVLFEDADGGSNLVVDNSGLIRAGALGTAIDVIGNNTATITNQSAGTITGYIYLGTNAASSFTNSGQFVGDVIFENAAQVMNLENGSWT